MTPEEARVWIDRFKQTLSDESTDQQELRDGWREFRRTYARGFWPSPGEVCKAIRETRSDRNLYRDKRGPGLPAPNYTGPEKVSMRTRLRTMAALDAARQMVADGNPLGPALVRLGESIITRNGAGEG